MQVIDMFEYSEASFRRNLKALFDELDRVSLTFSDPLEVRQQFFHRMRGRFLAVAKLKRHTPLDEFLPLIRMSSQNFKNIEEGNHEISDGDFFKISTFLGCSNESDIFLEKLEKALTPGLREARQGLEKVLFQYGIRFADSELNKPK